MRQINCALLSYLQHTFISFSYAEQERLNVISFLRVDFANKKSSNINGGFLFCKDLSIYESDSFISSLL